LSELEAAVENEATETAAVVADVIAEDVAEETAKETALETVAPVVEAVEDLAEEIVDIVDDLKEETEWEKTRSLLTELTHQQTTAILAGIQGLMNPISPSPSETEIQEQMEDLEEATETAEEAAAVVEEAAFDPTQELQSENETSASTASGRRRLVGRGRRK
jgi:hypothetical protein